MIIKGGPAGNIDFWARHLLRDDTNEVARLVEVRGLLAEDLPSALREMQAIAAQSRSRGNFMYQANINPRRDADLTPGQFAEAVDLLERNLGFFGRQRVVVEHVKDGRRHYHVIWNRVDASTLKVADITGNYDIHRATARELERRFGLAPVAEGKRRSRRSELWEERAAERSGIPREKVASDLQRIWTSTASGETFRLEAEMSGYVLAKGDRRDFCIVDKAGDVHSLARRVPGIVAADIRRRFSDLDRDGLPSVAEARSRQRLRSDFRQSGKSAAGRGGRRQAPVRAARAVTFHRGFRRAARFMTQTAPFGSVTLSKAMRIHQPAMAETSPSASSASPPAASPTVSSASAASLADGPRRPDAAGLFDPVVAGRAEAAYTEEFAKWQAKIDAAQTDPSLTPDQRAQAIIALRSRQRLEAEARRRRIIEDEKQRVRAVRRNNSGGHKPHRPKGPR